MVKNMLYWSSGIILGPLRPLWDIGKLAMFGHFWPQKGHYDKGFPKGVGGGGGVRRLGKNFQMISFFLLESVPYQNGLYVTLPQDGAAFSAWWPPWPSWAGARPMSKTWIVQSISFLKYIVEQDAFKSILFQIQNYWASTTHPIL